MRDLTTAGEEAAVFRVLEDVFAGRDPTTRLAGLQERYGDDAAFALLVHHAGDDNTLLHLGAYADNVAWLSCVLARGSTDINVRNANGETPLHWAAKMNSTASVDVLLNAGADVDARDKSLSCPLHVAAGQGHPEMVALLLNRRCDAAAVDGDGASALAVARQQLQRLSQAHNSQQQQPSSSARKEKEAGPGRRNAYMAVITVLKRHAQGPAVATAVVAAATADSPPRGRGLVREPSCMRSTDRSRSPSPKAAAAKALRSAHRVDPLQEPPKPAFYIPKVRGVDAPSRGRCARVDSLVLLILTPPLHHLHVGGVRTGLLHHIVRVGRRGRGRHAAYQAQAQVQEPVPLVPPGLCLRVVGPRWRHPVVCAGGAQVAAEGGHLAHEASLQRPPQPGQHAAVRGRRGAG